MEDFTRIGEFTWRVSGCEELVGRSITVKKAASSKAVELISGSKGDMSRRKNLRSTARNERKGRKSR